MVDDGPRERGDWGSLRARGTLSGAGDSPTGRACRNDDSGPGPIGTGTRSNIIELNQRATNERARGDPHCHRHDDTHGAVA